MNYTIGIDTRMLHKTGIGTYLKGLLRGFSRTTPEPRHSLCAFGQKLAPEHPNARLHTRPFYASIYSIGEQIEYPFRLKNCRIWHAPHYNVPLATGRTRLVVTIHDIIHWIFRKDFFSPLQAFYAGRMLKAAVRKADRIIAVSNKTRDDLLEHFDADPEKVRVIYEGVSEEFHELAPEAPIISSVRKKYGIPGPFFLYVGMIKPHKNVLGLLRMFRKLKNECKIQSTLVLVGRKDARYPKDFQELAGLQSGRDVIHLPFVEKGELVALYNAALALVHPSLYEGFGLTLLEAMACAAPVLACRAASIPEIAGEAACLVDPCAEREMMDALVRLEKAPGLREEYRRKGRQQAARFRWEDTARKTAEVYEEVLALGPSA